MEGEPANEEKPSAEEWPLERAEVGVDSFGKSVLLFFNCFNFN